MGPSEASLSTTGIGVDRFERTELMLRLRAGSYFVEAERLTRAEGATHILSSFCLALVGTRQGDRPLIRSKDSRFACAVVVVVATDDGADGTTWGTMMRPETNYTLLKIGRRKDVQRIINNVAAMNISPWTRQHHRESWKAGKAESGDVEVPKN